MERRLEHQARAPLLKGATSRARRTARCSPRPTARGLSSTPRAHPFEHRRVEPLRVVRGLRHEGGGGGKKNGPSNALCAMTSEVALISAPPSGCPTSATSRAETAPSPRPGRPRAYRCRTRSPVRPSGRDLGGRTRDAPHAALDEVRHQIVPHVGRHRLTRDEDDRVPLSPVAVEQLRPVRFDESLDWPPRPFMALRGGRGDYLPGHRRLARLGNVRP